MITSEIDNEIIQIRSKIGSSTSMAESIVRYLYNLGYDLNGRRTPAFFIEVIPHSNRVDTIAAMEWLVENTDLFDGGCVDVCNNEGRFYVYSYADYKAAKDCGLRGQILAITATPKFQAIIRNNILRKDLDVLYRAYCRGFASSDDDERELWHEQYGALGRVLDFLNAMK